MPGPAMRMRHLAYRAMRARRDALVRGAARDAKTLREDVAARYVRGAGIEIGALDFPLRVPSGVAVRYVDHLDEAGLRRTYASTLRAGRPLVVPDIVDDGCLLSSIRDESQDFVIANHMLEHAEDPIAALQHQLRVLRGSGILFLTLPDARATFDAPRKRTTVEHLLRDHHHGPDVSRREHYEECARLIEGHTDATVTARIAEMEAERLRPHFHVWEPTTFAAFLGALDLPFSLELLQSSDGEFVAVLRKQA